MTNVLILGGTGWLSGRIARAWMDAGASVTCLARGGRPAPAGAELISADRDGPHAYDALAGREWDEVVDISSLPAHVAAAIQPLGAHTAHWTYMSSVSVYARNDEPEADETAELSMPAEPGEECDYSRAKSAAEASVRAVLGDRAGIVRPGLIVGPGDPTDRFGYWVARFALAGSEPVLVPTTAGRMSQVIDVDDLAAFGLESGRRGWNGTANAIGSPVPLGAVLELARETAGHTGALVEASDDDLAAAGVAHWSGARSLPLWLPPDMPGFATRRNDGYLDAGGAIRPLAETIARTLADERARGLDRERKAGLSRADEMALITRLR